MNRQRLREIDSNSLISAWTRSKLGLHIIHLDLEVSIEYENDPTAALEGGDTIRSLLFNSGYHNKLPSFCRVSKVVGLKCSCGTMWMLLTLCSPGETTIGASSHVLVLTIFVSDEK